MISRPAEPDPTDLSPRWAVVLALAVALSFPTALGWVEFRFGQSRGPGLNLTGPLAYGLCQALMLTYPLAYAWVLERRLPRPGMPSWGGLGLGLGFGAVVAAGIVGLYFGWLRATVLFETAAVKVHAKLDEFYLDSPGGFVVFAFFVAVVHSLLEEYYWRWFLFGRLKRLAAPVWAMVLSSLAFMAPHVFPLATFLGTEFVVAVALFTLCVGVGGLAWCWLFEKSGSLYSCWLSHLVIDIALFVVAYDLFFVR
jgi:membrane protease YdiL (CAAX protease family)